MSADGVPRISVCIVCRDEAEQLARCLESVRWADEIIVMDLSSRDGSAAVAERCGARVLTHAPVPLVELVRNAVAAAATGEWILALDPDERITPGLAEALRRASGRDDIDLVWMPFTHLDLGHRPGHATHRYDPKPRMYRRAAVTWPEVPHALPVVPEARTLRLPAVDELVVLHERNATVDEALDRLARWAPLHARSMHEAGEVFTARAMLAALGGKIWRQFFVARAFRDGVPGVLRAGILVAYYFYVWAYLWQLAGARRTPADDRVTRRAGVLVSALLAVARVVTLPGRLLRRRVPPGA